MDSLQFGLSLDPADVPQRHCFYDSDEEGDETEELSDLLCYSGTAETRTPLTVLCTTPISAAFVCSHFAVSEEQTAAIKCTQPSKVIKGQHFPATGRRTEENEEESVTMVYQAKGSSALVVVQKQLLNPNLCNVWADKLLDQLQPQAVVVLHSEPLHLLMMHEHQDESVMSLLQSMQTCSWSYSPLAPFSSPPNTISGEPASILTSCQLRGIPAAMATLYASNMLTATEKVQAFKSIGSHVLLKEQLPITNSRTSSEALLKKCLPKPSSDLATLYT